MIGRQDDRVTDLNPNIPQGPSMQALDALNERAREIFRQIVESYLTTGEPVGSRNLARILPMALSPASIRNVMADLEHSGLIFAPHTSAGRLPTELGLRFFVDAMLEVGDVGQEEQARIEAQMRAAASGHTFDSALAEASTMLSGISRGAGVVLTTKANVHLKHIEFVRLDPARALVVLVSDDGSVENRLRYPLEVFRALREAWPKDKPMSVRISATDWAQGGLSPDDSVAIAEAFAAEGCDLVDVSTGQTARESRPVYGRMFQTPFSDRIRNEARVATMCVGNITTADQVNTIVAAGRADLVALGRPHLADPSFVLRAAAWYGVDIAQPVQYAPGKDQLMRNTPREREDLEALKLKAKPSRHAVAAE